MKKSIRLSALVGSCGALFLSSFAAHAQDSKFYVKAAAGGALTSDTTLKEFFGPVTTGSKVTFDPGARLTLAGGYEVTDWLATEAETGVIGNRINSVTGATRIHDASLSNFPFLLNLRFQVPNNACPFTPYAGGGVGGSVSVLDADHLDIGGTSFHGSQSTAVFAYQAFAGVRYRINAHMGVSVEYRYFGSTGPDWQADVAVGTASDRAKFGGAETHSVNLAFDYKF